MADWLTPEAARALLELEPLSSDAEDPERVSFTGALDAATDFVENKRSDLFTDAEPPVYEPGASVILGTAMLAHRWWQRRASPFGAAGYAEFAADAVLRHDPDIAKMLGIGTAGRFMFGAAVPVDPPAAPPPDVEP